MLTRCSLTIVAVLLAMVASALGAPGDMLAEWDGGGITVKEFKAWWERIPADRRPALETLEEKQVFLDNMITAKIMIDEAEKLGLDEHPTILEWVRQRRANMLREHLLTRATRGRIDVPATAVDEVMEKRQVQMRAGHIVAPTLSRAESLLDSLEAGVSFESLAHRYSTCPSAVDGGDLGPVRWGMFSDRWSARAFALEAGEYSQPFQVEGGYCIVHVESRTEMALDNAEAERQAVRKSLERQEILDERQEYLDSLRIAYRVELKVDNVITLCAGYAQALEMLGEERAVVDQDIDPPLLDSQRALPVATYRGGEFTVDEVVDLIISQPYPVRPELDNPDQMIPFISRSLNDTLLLMEAEKLRLDEIPEIADNLDKIKQKQMTQYFFRYLVRDLEIPEEAVRAHYEEHRTDYVLEGGHTAAKIVVQTKEEADSILALIRSGEDSFAAIAKRSSIDPFTAPQGGEMGFYELGKDREFDGFWKTMDEGDMEVFRSVEGFVVLWLKDRREARKPSFEEIREQVVEDLTPAYKDKFLMDWAAEQRRERGVEVYGSALEEVELPS
jgi:peptidyl-prolyl cis-trans isomerase C